MPTKRALLSEMTVEELRASADLFELDGFDRRIRDNLIDAIGGSRKARINEILVSLPRARLKELCRAFDLSDAGTRKADIAARLVGPAKSKKGRRGKRASATTKKDPEPSGATTGYEAELWAMADALRGNVDAAEYKHVVLGLIFLKYISDAFEEHRAKVLADWGEEAVEDRDEYTAENIFWVPKEAWWARLKEQARQPTIGQIVDDAMVAIERDNPAIKDVLPKNYARQGLDKTRLGQLIDLVSNIKVGDAEARSRDVLGRVYEYFLGQFASAEGKKGGEFYTPRCIVKLLVEMLQPYRGRVFDPCCGSAGMFVQSDEFIRSHASGNANGGKAKSDLSIFGQESNHTTWRLAQMNLAIRGIAGRIEYGDSFHNDRHPDLKADFILANPRSMCLTGVESASLRTSGGNTAPRPRATPTLPGSSISCITWRPVESLGSCLRTDRCLQISPAKGRSGRAWSKRTWLTAWWRCRGNCSIQHKSLLACGFWLGIDATAKIETASVKPYSSTRAGWAAWLTVHTVSLPVRTLRKLPKPTMLGAKAIDQRNTQTCLATARASRWRR